MRRNPTKLALLALGALAALPAGQAPAERSGTAMPRARDFEQPLPLLRSVGPTGARAAPKAAGAGPVLFRSPPIEAPRRFDAVGVAGTVKPVEFRARRDGGRWSNWVASADGDPVFTGGSDWVQVRSRGWRPRGVLHYVSVPKLPAPPALAAAKRSGRPAVVSRRQWGADAASGGCAPRTGPLYGRVKAAVVHHTVSTNSYTEAQAPAIVLAICRFHERANGWNDIGYNALVDRFGNLYVGRAGGLGKAVVGAQAQGFNAQTTGIASIGTYTQAKMPRLTIRAIARFLAWKLPRSGLDASGHSHVVSAGGDLTQYPAGTRLRIRRVVGHQRLDATSCPGAGGESQLAKVRALTQSRIDGGGSGGVGP